MKSNIKKIENKGKLFRYRSNTLRDPRKSHEKYGIIIDENPEEYGPGWIKVMWSDTGKVGRASFVMVEIIN